MTLVIPKPQSLGAFNLCTFQISTSRGEMNTLAVKFTSITYDSTPICKSVGGVNQTIGLAYEIPNGVNWVYDL